MRKMFELLPGMFAAKQESAVRGDGQILGALSATGNDPDSREPSIVIDTEHGELSWPRLVP
jgi:hypothetical protein